MGFRSKAARYYELYLFLVPAFLYFIIFHYLPMYGVIIGFKKFSPSKGIWGSSWVGLEHFENFVHSIYFWDLLRNTIELSLYQLVVTFPAPILLALMLNEALGTRFKMLVQTITYAPHFIATVVIVGMLIAFLSPTTGIVNKIGVALGGEAFNYMASPAWFKTIYVLSEAWQGVGWGSIIYLAALAGINPELKEAATIDGATIMQRIRYINIPSILPVIVILLILNFGSIMSIGFEKIYLMQNALNMTSSDVIPTYVYRKGLLNGEYSFSTAVGLFNSVINFVLLLLVNGISKRLKGTSLW